MSQLDIKIRKLQDNGSTFRANIETLYLGGVRSAKVDRLHFEVPEEWKACTISLHVQRLSGTLPDPQILDENNSALVDRRWTLEKEGTWMLLAINDSGYIAMTKPGKYTCYDTIDTDTTTENITPSIYEQFVAEVTKYAKQALESMNAAKASEEAAAKSAKEAANSAASMKESVRVSGENAKKAANSAAAAKKSEEAAAKSAEASENSAKKSAESESASKDSAEKAKDSEEAAKKSEDAAALSETNAAASEKNAKTSETAAKQALQDTETEHTAALQDIARARTTALNDVANSTRTATAAAENATQQATAAAGSASTASTKAGEASASAGEASASRQAAEKAQKAAEDAAALAGTRAGTDKTLSVPDAPADAKAVGDKFKSIKTDWNSVTDKPETFPSTWDSVSGKPSSYPPSAHNHDASAIVSGTLPIARGGTGQTTDRSACETLLWRNELSGAPNWDALETGIWRTTPESWGANGPSGVYKYGIVMVWNYAGNVTQVYIAHSTGEMAFRQRWNTGNGFSAWAHVNTNTITSQTSDPGAGSSLATGTVLLVYA